MHIDLKIAALVKGMHGDSVFLHIRIKARFTSTLIVIGTDGPWHTHRHSLYPSLHYIPLFEKESVHRKRVQLELP